MPAQIGALNLLTVRSRLLTGDFASGKEGGVSQPADLNMAPWTITFFKLSLGAVGPTFSTQVLANFSRTACALLPAEPHRHTPLFQRLIHGTTFGV